METTEKIAKEKSKVSLDYEGRLESGEIFDTSKHDDHSHPLTFTIGAGEVIQGFENAALGMKIGEEKEFSIEPKEAYGEYDPVRVRWIPRDQFPPTKPEPKKGMQILVSLPEGEQVPLRIADVNETQIAIDMNHPLAGKKLIFKIKVLSIE